MENDQQNSACTLIEAPDHSVIFIKREQENLLAFNKSEHGIAFQIQRDSSPFLVTQPCHI